MIWILRHIRCRRKIHKVPDLESYKNAGLGGNNTFPEYILICMPILWFI